MQHVSHVIPIVVFLYATFTRAQQLAFPGAEGYGRFALEGHGGKVLFVTNLNDKGPGSLRAAIEAKVPRILVFNIWPGHHSRMFNGETGRSPRYTETEIKGEEL